MKAFIFESSNQYVGSFKVRSESELELGVKAFLANKSIPANSYVELNGQKWTIVSAHPVQLAQGHVRRPAQAGGAPVDPAKVAKDLADSRRIIDYGVGIGFGGLFLFLREVVGGEFNAGGVQLGVLGTFLGILFSKSIRGIISKKPVFIAFGIIYLIIFGVWLTAMIRASVR